MKKIMIVLALMGVGCTQSKPEYVPLTTTHATIDTFDCLLVGRGTPTSISTGGGSGFGSITPTDRLGSYFEFKKTENGWVAIEHGRDCHIKDCKHEIMMYGDGSGLHCSHTNDGTIWGSEREAQINLERCTFKEQTKH